MSRRGVALYLVLAILLVVTILTSAILTLISSQTKLSNHQIRRTQAYYAAQAGINYALEQLRLNTTGWVPPDNTTQLVRYMCRDGNPPCPINPPNVSESSLPGSINYVKIFIGPRDVSLDLTYVNATANYTGF
jgi:Tfp pilus assembly protein PilX